MLTTRIVLNIREAASRRLHDFSFDLHLSDADLRAPTSRIAFAEDLAVIHFGDDRTSDAFQHERLGSEDVARSGMVSISGSTGASHITLPMTRDAKGERVVGRPEPDDDDDDDKYSIGTSPDEWV